LVICLFSGFSVFLKDNWDTPTFVTNYIPLMIAPILFLGATIVLKAKFIKAEDMDFVTGLAQIEAESYDEPKPRNLWEAFWAKIVRLSLS
jgi:amino acid transporter